MFDPTEEEIARYVADRLPPDEIRKRLRQIAAEARRIVTADHQPATPQLIALERWLADAKTEPEPEG